MAEDEETEQVSVVPSKQILVSMVDEFGSPFCFGVRVIPKTGSIASLPYCYGVEVVLHAELWFVNHTGLPLNFGCPLKQLESTRATNDNGPGESSLETVGRAAAEAALNEIASVFELGEKGKELAVTALMPQSDIRSIPFQRSMKLTIEVFEYLEIENRSSKRRWWASDRHDVPRCDPALLKTGSLWSWLDKEWVSFRFFAAFRTVFSLHT